MFMLSCTTVSWGVVLYVDIFVRHVASFFIVQIDQLLLIVCIQFILMYVLTTFFYYNIRPSLLELINVLYTQH